MYIRYNNSSNQRPQGQHQVRPIDGTDNRQWGNPSGQKEHRSQKREEKRQGGGFKTPLNFLPKELYNPETHKFFGKLSAEDILLIGLILLVLDQGSGDDLFLALALFYILLSDYMDFGNILF